MTTICIPFFYVLYCTMIVSYHCSVLSCVLCTILHCFVSFIFFFFHCHFFVLTHGVEWRFSPWFGTRLLLILMYRSRHIDSCICIVFHHLYFPAHVVEGFTLNSLLDKPPSQAPFLPPRPPYCVCLRFCFCTGFSIPIILRSTILL